MKHFVHIGVFGVITNVKNEILLVHRNDFDAWNLPGGGLEPEESPWAGVLREIKEETGLDAEVVKLLGMYSKPQKDEIVLNFECKIIGGELTLNEEARAFGYFENGNIPENTIPKQKERIQDYFENSTDVILKIQKGQFFSDPK